MLRQHGAVVRPLQVTLCLPRPWQEERSKKFRSNNQLEAKYKVKFERRLAKLRLQKSAVSKAERDVERVHSLVQQANQRVGQGAWQCMHS